ncbi:MAG: hypothetical protein WCK17_12050, partial [Verrucomicrobiota bacterium]
GIGYGRVAERFKAPVLKFACTCIVRYRHVSNSIENIGFLGAEVVLRYALYRAVLPNWVAKW